ncbi:hypothetical protein GHT06_010758 [Daphnia sinensis]|uniref:small monomeric GTPase n=1 Tax=Daphnia sinensis TaxID=1820382 RepID=A0AAD5LJS2_9CRUS|nr:hypothetical protein GHT06_010758 [Daphnia sinensis]
MCFLDWTYTSRRQLISDRACRRVGHANRCQKMTKLNHLIGIILVNVICSFVAFVTVVDCLPQQLNSQRKAIVLRSLQQVSSSGNNSLLNGHDTDAILPVGEAFNLFQSYGLLAFNINVAPLILVSAPSSRAIANANGSPTQPFSLPLFQMTTHPVLDQKLYTPENSRPHMNNARGHQQLMEVMDRSVRLHLCRTTEDLMIRFLSGFTVDGLSKPWWAFAAAWKKHVIPRIYGVPPTYLTDDNVFLLVRIEKRSIVGSINGSMLLEPDLMAKLPSPSVLDVSGKVDTGTHAGSKQWRSAVDFFLQFGTHIITDYSVGDALFQVIVYNASSLPLLSEKMAQLRAEQFNPVNATKFDWIKLLLSHPTPVHVGKLQLISGNRTLINWLEPRLALSTLPETIPSSIRLLGAPVLFNLFYRQMQPRAVLKVKLTTSFCGDCRHEYGNNNESNTGHVSTQMAQRHFAKFAPNVGNCCYSPTPVFPPLSLSLARCVLVAGAPVDPCLPFSIRRKKSLLSEIKVLVVGGPGVGKSALTVRYLTKRYIGEYDHQSENRYKHEAMINGEPVIFEILDTCPKSDKDLLAVDSIQWADGFLLVYSILDKASFDYIQRFRRHVLEIRNIGTSHGKADQQPATASNTIPCVLVGNKADMVHLRQVPTHEGEQLAKEMECYFAEVAAAEQVSSIADAFVELGREVHSARRRSKPPISSSSTHSTPSLFDRMLGSRSSASIGSIRAYARGKSDSALPKD